VQRGVVATAAVCAPAVVDAVKSTPATDASRIIVLISSLPFRAHARLGTTRTHDPMLGGGRIGRVAAV
jgi:hypothetical protein